MSSLGFVTPRNSSSLVPLAGLALVALSASAVAQVTAVNVEVDYLVAGDHTHMPQPAEINALVAMFACHGITLTVDVDDAIAEGGDNDVLQCPDTGSNFFSCDGDESFKSIKDAFFDRAGQAGWHYCVFGHDYDAGAGVGSSGVAQLGGSDLLVSLGSFAGQVGTPFARASTFAHELGHNLGLNHFSPGSTGSPGDFQPNYASVMSYQYQLNGIRGRMEAQGLVEANYELNGRLFKNHLFKQLDYSNGRLPSLAELTLHESEGLGVVPIDWSCDGDTTDVATVDLGAQQNWCSADTTNYGIITDYNDWDNLVDTTFLPPEGASEPAVVTCITYSEFLALGGSSEGGGPALSTESCEAGEMFWVDASHMGIQDGTGEHPFQTLDLAVLVAVPDSILYVQPGSYTASAPITESLVLVGGQGGVVIN